MCVCVYVYVRVSLQPSIHLFHNMLQLAWVEYGSSSGGVRTRLQAFVAMSSERDATM